MSSADDPKQNSMLVYRGVDKRWKNYSRIISKERKSFIGFEC
jgi:hypothetical protein